MSLFWKLKRSYCKLRARLSNKRKRGKEIGKRTKRLRTTKKRIRKTQNPMSLNYNSPQLISALSINRESNSKKQDSKIILDLEKSKIGRKDQPPKPIPQPSKFRINSRTRTTPRANKWSTSTSTKEPPRPSLRRKTKCTMTFWATWGRQRSATDRWESTAKKSLSLGRDWSTSAMKSNL